MTQIFRPAINTISRVSIAGAVVVLVGLIVVAYELYWSPAVTNVDVPREQQIPFSHKHHVGGLGIDCRFCHTSVEESSFAGIPATRICMTCHSQIWKESPMLARVRESYEKGQPLQWIRVHDLPDFVYFDHSIHVNKGIGCSTCHGDVDHMPLTWKTENLFMSWCLGCHRAPERYVRPKDEIFSMTWKAPEDQVKRGSELMERYGIRKEHLTNCSICHR